MDPFLRGTWRGGDAPLKSFFTHHHVVGSQGQQPQDDIIDAKDAKKGFCKKIKQTLESHVEQAQKLSGKEFGFSKEFLDLPPITVENEKLIDSLLSLSWEVFASDQKKLQDVEKRNEVLLKRLSDSNKAYLMEISMLRDQARPGRLGVVNNTENQNLITSQIPQSNLQQNTTESVPRQNHVVFDDTVVIGDEDDGRPRSAGFGGPLPSQSRMNQTGLANFSLAKQQNQSITSTQQNQTMIDWNQAPKPQDQKMRSTFHNDSTKNFDVNGTGMCGIDYEVSHQSQDIDINALLNRDSLSETLDKLLPEIAPNTTFYEPMRFLDENMRQLVLLVVEEQLKVAFHERNLALQWKERQQKIETFKKLHEERDEEIFQRLEVELQHSHKKIQDLELTVQEEKRRSRDILGRANMRVEQSEKDLEELLSEKETREINNRVLLSEVQKLKDSVEKLENEKKNLRNEIEKFQIKEKKNIEELDALHIEKKEWLDSKQILRDQNLDIVEQLENCQSQIEKDVAYRKMIEHEHQSLLLDKISIEQKLKQQQQQFSETLESHTRVLEEKSELENELIETKTILEKQTKELLLVKEEESKLSSENERLSSLNTEFERNCKELHREKDVIQGFFLEKQELAFNLQREKDKISSEKELVEAKKDVAEAELNNMKGKLDIMTQKKDLLNKSFRSEKDKAEQLEHELHANRTEKERLTKIQKEQETEVSKLAEERESLLKKTAILESNVENLKNIVTLNNQFYKRIQEENTTKERKMQQKLNGLSENYSNLYGPQIGGTNNRTGGTTGGSPRGSPTDTGMNLSKRTRRSYYHFDSQSSHSYYSSGSCSSGGSYSSSGSSNNSYSSDRHLESRDSRLESFQEGGRNDRSRSQIRDRQSSIADKIADSLTINSPPRFIQDSKPATKSERGDPDGSQRYPEESHRDSQDHHRSNHRSSTRKRKRHRTHCGSRRRHRTHRHEGGAIDDENSKLDSRRDRRSERRRERRSNRSRRHKHRHHRRHRHEGNINGPWEYTESGIYAGKDGEPSLIIKAPMFQHPNSTFNRTRTFNSGTFSESGWLGTHGGGLELMNSTMHGTYKMSGTGQSSQFGIHSGTSTMGRTTIEDINKRRNLFSKSQTNLSELDQKLVASLLERGSKRGDAPSGQPSGSQTMAHTLRSATGNDVANGSSTHTTNINKSDSMGKTIEDEVCDYATGMADVNGSSTVRVSSEGQTCLNTDSNLNTNVNTTCLNTISTGISGRHGKSILNLETIDRYGLMVDVELYEVAAAALQNRKRNQLLMQYHEFNRTARRLGFLNKDTICANNIILPSNGRHNTTLHDDDSNGNALCSVGNQNEQTDGNGEAVRVSSASSDSNTWSKRSNGASNGKKTITVLTCSSFSSVSKFSLTADKFNAKLEESRSRQFQEIQIIQRLHAHMGIQNPLWNEILLQATHIKRSKRNQQNENGQQNSQNVSSFNLNFLSAAVDPNSTFPPSFADMRSKVESKTYRRMQKYLGKTSDKKQNSMSGSGNNNMSASGGNAAAMNSNQHTGMHTGMNVHNGIPMHSNNVFNTSHMNRSSSSATSTAAGRVKQNYQDQSQMNKDAILKRVGETWNTVDQPSGGDPFANKRKQRRKKTTGLLKELEKLLDGFVVTNVGSVEGSTGESANGVNLMTMLAKHVADAQGDGNVKVEVGQSNQDETSEKNREAGSSVIVAQNKDKDPAKSFDKDAPFKDDPVLTVPSFVYEMFVKLKQELMDSQNEIEDLEGQQDAISSLLQNSDRHIKKLQNSISKYKKLHETTQSSNGFRNIMGGGSLISSTANSTMQGGRGGTGFGGGILQGGIMNRTQRSESNYAMHLSQITDDMQRQLHETETQLWNTFSKLDVETQQKLEAENLVTALEREIRELEENFRNKDRDGKGNMEVESVSCGMSELGNPSDFSEGSENGSQDCGADGSIVRNGPKSSKKSRKTPKDDNHHDDAPHLSAANLQCLAAGCGLGGGESGTMINSVKIEPNSLCEQCRLLQQKNEESERTITRLRVIVNEMSMRLVRLKDNLEGENDVQNETADRVFRRSGLGDFLKGKSTRNVFNRLYQDALKRVRRLEEATREGNANGVLRILSTEDIPENLKEKIVYKGNQILNQNWQGTVSKFRPGENSRMTNTTTMPKSLQDESLTLSSSVSMTNTIGVDPTAGVMTTGRFLIPLPTKDNPNPEGRFTTGDELLGSMTAEMNVDLSQRQDSEKLALTSDNIYVTDSEIEPGTFLTQEDDEACLCPGVTSRSETDAQQITTTVGPTTTSVSGSGQNSGHSSGHNSSNESCIVPVGYHGNQNGMHGNQQQHYANPNLVDSEDYSQNMLYDYARSRNLRTRNKINPTFFVIREDPPKEAASTASPTKISPAKKHFYTPQKKRLRNGGNTSGSLQPLDHHPSSDGKFRQHLYESAMSDHPGMHSDRLEYQSANDLDITCTGGMPNSGGYYRDVLSSGKKNLNSQFSSPNKSQFSSPMKFASPVKMGQLPPLGRPDSAGDPQPQFSSPTPAQFSSPIVQHSYSASQQQNYSAHSHGYAHTQNPLPLKGSFGPDFSLQQQQKALFTGGFLPKKQGSPEKKWR